MLHNFPYPTWGKNVYYSSFHGAFEIKIISQSHFPSFPSLDSLLCSHLENAIIPSFLGTFLPRKLCYQAHIIC